MFRLILLLVYANHNINAYGYDAGGGEQGACGRQYRAGRVHQPPCDLVGGYCTSAGSAYPWHAVRRFVRENHGLMRRMYGDQGHASVLQAELADLPLPGRAARRDDAAAENEVRPEASEPRFLRDEDIGNDDVLNTKFVYSEEPAISVKVGDLRTAPHFRPAAKATPKPPGEAAGAETATEPVTTTITAKVESSTGEEKPSAVLFQDVDADLGGGKKDKVVVGQQMKGVNACPVKEEVVAPFWANNTRGEVLALLNMYPFEQYVHWEKCTHEHRQMYCRDGCRCEQQYRLHRLLAYDPNNECRGIFSDWFRFPSCCVCKCYSIPLAEFRVTSRSPRANGIADWYQRKNEAIFG